MNLEWIDDRWHLDGRGIHAGEIMEIRWPDRTWQEVRIESSHHGARLYACWRHHGQDVSVFINIDDGHQLRWPQITAKH